MGKSKMKILEGLTKLRQICLHPKMIDPKYEGSSAKFDLLMTEVEKIMAEGHKVLIFSSFVFDNIPFGNIRNKIFAGFKRILKDSGILILIRTG